MYKARLPSRKSLSSGEGLYFYYVASVRVSKDTTRYTGRIFDSGENVVIKKVRFTLPNNVLVEESTLTLIPDEEHPAILIDKNNIGYKSNTKYPETKNVS